MNMAEEKNYQVGLFKKTTLHKNKDGALYYITFVNNRMMMLECDTKKNSEEMRKGVIEGNAFTKIDEHEIERGVTKVLSEDGTRWEGDWFNGKPFEFGSVYDGEGNRIYSGFICEGKKVGFGTEYFADNHKVD